MKRTPLTRHTPLSRRSPLRRDTPLPRLNRERQQRRREVGEVYGAYHAWIRAHRCILADHPQHRCVGPVEGAHVRSVGAGGKDVGNEVPLCVAAHRGDGASLHRLGRRSFEAHWGCDLAKLARGYAERWERRRAA